MKEWIKYMRYFLISNIILFMIISCDSTVETESIINETDTSNVNTVVLTKNDSLMNIARKYGVDVVGDSVNIHDVLDIMIMKQNILKERLDSIDNRANDMVELTYEYRKKKDEALKKKLLAEIDEIKTELTRIKKIAIDAGLLKKEDTRIKPKEINIDTKTFEALPAGNYVTRLDKYYLIRILVNDVGEVIVGNPILDSTTVIKGKPMSPRLKKELDQIRKQINNQ